MAKRSNNSGSVLRLVRVTEDDFVLLYVVTEDGCWVPRDKAPGVDGYTHLNFGGRKNVVGHRASYELHHGEIPEGKVVDHLCRNRACIRPDHLEAVTRKQNSLRGVGYFAENARKTSCVNGHPFSEENTYLRPDGTGRACRACFRDRARVYRSTKRQGRAQ